MIDRLLFWVDDALAAGRDAIRRYRLRVMLKAVPPPDCTDPIEQKYRTHVAGAFSGIPSNGDWVDWPKPYKSAGEWPS